MSKATTAIVSLLVAACVCVFTRRLIVPLATGGVRRRFLRYAAPALLVLLGCGPSWASFSLTFQGLVQTLNTGGSITLSSPSGIVVDTAGDVYIVDTGNSRIVEVNAQGVASVVTITGLSPALSGPNGIAIDGSGNLYVADTGNSRVVEITAAGAGSAISTGGVTLSSPKGIALDQSGDIFIADTGNSRVVEVTSGGAAAALTITVSSGSATLNTPIGLAVGVTGKLYIADSANNRIVTVAAGSTTGVVASILGGVTLSAPKAVTVDRMGNVFIADTGNSRIAEIDTSSNGDVLYTNSITLSGPLGVALDVFGTVYIADTGDNQALAVDPPVNADLVVGNPSYSLNKTDVGFGHVQLGSSTAVTLTLPFTTGGSGGLGAVKVFTSGVQGVDFTSGTDTTCNSSTGPSTLCSVEVLFLPTAPGLRNGAVVLYDTDLNPILTVPLYGWGDAPVAALSPNPGSVISTGGVTLSFPFQVALDGAGNMYVANDGGNVVRIPAGGGAATVVALPTGGEVDGVAVDGAGNLFVSDHLNNRILVVTPAGVVSTLSITGLSPVLGLPVALAFDGAGNLYIADYANGRIIRVSTLVVAGSTSSGLGTVIGTGAFTFTEDALTGLAVDAQGNIYADAQNGSSVVKVTAAGVASELSFPGITPAINDSQGVGVDAMGNIYVVDSANRRIVRLTTVGVASTLGISGLPAPSGLGSTLFGVTLDPLGNLYISDSSNNRIVFVNVSASVLAFPSTDVGSASSPETATVANLGDLPLIFATVPTYTVNFSEDTGDENLCALSTSLAAGILCDVAVEFTPQSAGSLSTGIVVTNNTLNVAAATQNIAVSGTGIAVADATSVAVSTIPASANIGQPLTVMATVTDTAAGHTATIPTGGVTFMDTVGSTSVSLNGGSAVTLSGPGKAILTGVTLSGAGTHTITAHYAGVSGSFLASSNTTTLTVAKDTATIAGPVTEPVQVVIGQAGSVPVTVTGTYSVGVVAAPTGSVSYNLLNSSNTSVASATATLTAGSTDSTATIPLPRSLLSGSYTVSLTYAGDSNYAAISTAVIVPVVVGAAVPTIVWTAPAGGITYGATLSAILNASAVSGSTPVAGTFTYTATLAGGSAVAVTAVTVLSAGSYTITATFTPTDTSTYASTTANASFTVAKATPAVVLTSSAAAVGSGSSVTFTATVTSSAGTPTGSVSFYDGTTLLGTGTLAAGIATYTTLNLPVGALSITAVYSGDTNFSILTSAGLTETVMTAYTVTAPTTPVPVAPGGAATIDITVPPLGGAFDGVVTLSAAGLPPGATATFNPPTVTPGSTGAPTVLTIQLAALTAGIPARDLPTNRRGLPLVPASLGFVLFGAVLGRKRIPRMLMLVFMLANLGVTTSLLTGCGGGFASTPSTPPGNYIITVTGTSGAFQASTTVTLVVQ
jgi:sugar lactone lactonase YvrE